MPFTKEPEPARFTLLPAGPGIGRVVAPNPGPMTCHGTNSWLIEDAGGLTLIDPGPDADDHLAALVAICAGRLERILVTHWHPDHVGLARRLSEATGAPSAGFAPPAGAAFMPDHLLADGAVVGGFRAIHTPGHAADHLCFEYRDLLFSGDHVMGWASSIVSPPEGDMAAYMSSLRRLLGGGHGLYLCGHGPVVTEPETQLRALLSHRLRRERAVVAALRKGPAGAADLMHRLYAKLDPALHWAAERNVLAHLIKLKAEGTVREEGALWRWVP